MQKCLDSYNTTFASFPIMLDYHQDQSEHSQCIRCPVRDLSVESLDRMSENHLNPRGFAYCVGEEAINDTTEHLGLALKVNGELYPVRETAYKTLLDRAKIGGSILPKLSRETLAGVLNECLHLSSTEALVLIRDEKVSAEHSGDETDYSVLPIDTLLEKLTEKLDERFPDSEFEQGYADHAITSGLWKLSGQREELLGTYIKTLSAYRERAKLDKIVPGVRFITKDTGVASAKVSALLLGGPYPIYIGGCIAVDHRHKTSVEDFEKALDQLFAQFGNSIEKLEHLLEVYLNYPVNAMSRVCKKLALPKKASLEAIDMFEEKAHQRFISAEHGSGRFSLSDNYTRKKNPELIMPLPDGTYLRAVAAEDDVMPNISIYLQTGNGDEEKSVCYAEYNYERVPGKKLCIGLWHSQDEDPYLYESFNKEKSS